MSARRRRARLRIFAALLAVTGAAALPLLHPFVSAATAAPKATVWVQTMDSCQSALGGAAYLIDGGSLGSGIVASTPPGAAKTVARTKGGCPLQQGDCVTVATGCISIAGFPVPGTYRVRILRTPPPDRANPEGYAACEGGSACWSEEATLTMLADGTVHATVTNVDPDGTAVTWPAAAQHASGTSFAGSRSDPIVFHDFGLAAPNPSGAGQCDGDFDADDHLTGTPGSHCAFPEAKEAGACQPYPWSCTLPAQSSLAPPPSMSPSPTRAASPRSPASPGNPGTPQSDHRSRGSHPNDFLATRHLLPLSDFTLPARDLCCPRPKAPIPSLPAATAGLPPGTFTLPEPSPVVIPMLSAAALTAAGPATGTAIFLALESGIVIAVGLLARCLTSLGGLCRGPVVRPADGPPGGRDGAPGPEPVVEGVPDHPARSRTAADDALAWQRWLPVYPVGGDSVAGDRAQARDSRPQTSATPQQADALRHELADVEAFAGHWFGS